jgi:hypothetical protein
VLRIIRKTKERWRKRRVDIIAQRKDSEFIQSIKDMMMTKSRRIRWMEHVACWKEIRNNCHKTFHLLPKNPTIKVNYIYLLIYTDVNPSISPTVNNMGEGCLREKC